jgi:hypothetical protein
VRSFVYLQDCPRVAVGYNQKFACDVVVAFIIDSRLFAETWKVLSQKILFWSQATSCTFNFLTLYITCPENCAVG